MKLTTTNCIYRKPIIFLFILSIAMTVNSQKPRVAIALYYRFQDIGFSYKLCPYSQGYYSNVFIMYNGRVIENADIATFEVLEDGYAKDKNRAYYEG